MTSMSAAEVPTSSAVTYAPPSWSTVSPKSSSAAARRSGERASPRSMITPFPPPSGSPATADLYVIARERRSASRTAARESS